MHFRADPMFPGDLLDAAARFALDTAALPPDAAWQQARAMGWHVMLVDEARGGAGGTLADLAAVVEGCARHAAALPIVRRCALAPALLMAARTPSADAALRALAAGTLDVDVASGCCLEVDRLGDGSVRVHGTIDGADAALPATHLLVPAPGALLLVPRDRLPTTWPRVRGIDGACTADVAVSGLDLPPDVVLASGSTAAAATAAEDVAMLVTAIEIAATLGALVEHCIAHLSTRIQFGVALATFQVLRHRVVEMYVQYEAASVMLARLTSEAVGQGAASSRDIALAKLYLNDLARRGAEAAIQLHGGMGMTPELPATRLAQRLLAAEFEYGDRLALLDRLELMAPAHHDAPNHDAVAPMLTGTT